MKEKNRKNLRRGVEIFLFALYLAMLSYFLFFADRMGRAFSERVYHYNLTLLKEIRRFWNYRHTLGSWAVVLNLAGNVIAFFPFGIFLPRLFQKCKNIPFAVLLCFEFSLCIEMIQLVTKVGCFDVDDIILNTLGGFGGTLIYQMYGRLSKSGKKGGWKEGNERKKTL